MRLGVKTVLMTGSAMAVLFAVLGAVSWHVVCAGFTELEDAHAYRDIERVRGAIDDREASLLTAVADWTTWDEMYRFVADKNQVFVEENLNAAAMEALKIQYLSLTDPSHAPIWQGLLGADGVSFSPIPTALSALTDRSSPMTTFDDTHDSSAGIVDVGGRLMLVASRPVMTSTGKGAPRGTLLMGRFLDAEEIAKLSASLRMDVSFSAASLFSGRVFLERLAHGDVIRKERRDVMNGYGLLRDVFGAPAAVLCVAVPRDIFAQGIRTGRLFATVLAGVGVIFVLFFVLLLRRLVLSRVESVSRSIAEISRTQDFDRRVAVKGHDELGDLAADINGMLGQVVSSRERLAKAHEEIQAISAELRRVEHEEFKVVLDEMGDAVIVCDETWEVSDINRSARRLLGITEDTPANVIARLYAWFDVSVAKETLAATLTPQLRFDAVRKKAVPAKAQYLEAVLNVITDTAGSVIRRLLVIRDVSATRQEDVVRQDLLEMVAHKLSLPVSEIEAETRRLRAIDAHSSSVAAISRQAQVLKSLVEKLLMFTEAMSAHQTMLVDVIALQPHFFGRAQKLFDVGRTVDVRVKCIDKSLAVRASRMAFDLIIDNLIDNAARFGDKDPTVIELSAVREGSSAVITVSDNGPGISIEEMVRAFPGSQQQARPAVGREFGASVTLALVKRLVDANDGTIGINSLEGSGTTFTLVFPADCDIIEK